MPYNIRLTSKILSPTRYAVLCLVFVFNIFCNSHSEHFVQSYLESLWIYKSLFSTYSIPFSPVACVQLEYFKFSLIFLRTSGSVGGGVLQNRERLNIYSLHVVSRLNYGYLHILHASLAGLNLVFKVEAGF